MNVQITSVIIDGQTIHSALDFKFGTTPKPLSDKKIDTFRVNLSELKLIIIDEVSMVSCDMLYNVHRRLCKIFQNNKLFGGIGIILVGDMLQLRPVKARYIFEEPEDEQHQVLYHSEDSLWNMFDVVNLVHNHRQGEGSNWAEILNRFRDETFTEEDVKMLEGRVIEDAEIPDDACHVFYRNADVAECNETMLETLKLPQFDIKASYRCPPGYRPKIQQYGTVANTSMVNCLHIRKGARIMLVANVNTSDSLVNGAMGCIVDIVKFKDSSEVQCIIIAFDNPKVGRNQREDNPHLSAKYKNRNGTPIFRHDFQYYLPSCTRKTHAAKASVIQFPIKLAWAITGHKMQVSLF